MRKKRLGYQGTAYRLDLCAEILNEQYRLTGTIGFCFEKHRSICGCPYHPESLRDRRQLCLPGLFDQLDKLRSARNIRRQQAVDLRRRGILPHNAQGIRQTTYCTTCAGAKPKRNSVFTQF